MYEIDNGKYSLHVHNPYIVDQLKLDITLKNGVFTLWVGRPDLSPGLLSRVMQLEIYDEQYIAHHPSEPEELLISLKDEKGFILAVRRSCTNDFTNQPLGWDFAPDWLNKPYTIAHRYDAEIKSFEVRKGRQNEYLA